VMHKALGHDQGAWLRRQLVAAIRSLASVTYHGALSAALARWYATMVAPTAIAVYLRNTRAVLWPQGRWKAEAAPPRPPGQLWWEKEEALAQLLALVPASAASVLGDADLSGALYRIWLLLQSPALLRSFIFSLADLLLSRLFPDAAQGLWGRQRLERHYGTQWGVAVERAARDARRTASDFAASAASPAHRPTPISAPPPQAFGSSGPGTPTDAFIRTPLAE